MKRIFSNTLFITLALLVSVVSFSQNTPKIDSIAVVKNDTIVPLKYNFKNNQTGGLFLNNPSAIEVSYDKVLNKFVVIERVGDYRIGTPIFMSPREYDKYRLRNDMKGYFKEKVSASSKKGGSEKARKNLLPKYYVNSKFFESVFGGSEVEVIPTGQVNIKLGGIYQNTENPQISVENQSSFTFDFDQQISTSLQAKVGTRLKVTANYDTQSTFDFQNIIKLEYSPTEDDIIQKLDAGNVNLPIKNALINGAQSLFGVRADFQFGKTTIRTAFSQQNSESKTVVAKGGAVIEEFELNATDYDNDRHFFLSQFFRETYGNALKNYPLVSSPINITRVEVWVTNTTQNVADYRSIVAFADIGETEFNGSNNNLVNAEITPPTPTTPLETVSVGGVLANLPYNQANILYDLFDEENEEIRTTGGIGNAVDGVTVTDKMQQGRDYSYLQNARKLQPNEFDLHSQLGFISLNRRLNDGEALAVAYEYTVVGAKFSDTGAPSGNTVFKVGEFSNDGITAPANLAVKLLRSEILTTSRNRIIDTEDVPFPTWRLMMKNVYALGAYPLQKEGFLFELMYRDDKNGVQQNTLQNAVDTNLHDQTLLSLFQVDKLDESQFFINGGNGFFDYVEGITVNSAKGLIFFPEAEPFGEDLEDEITTTADIDTYVFKELYLTTKAQAKNEYQDKDKYFLKGYFKSETSSGISLGAFNIPRGSVRVTAGGRQLVEGVDYVVDYQLGSVQILDPSIEASGTPINATVENNTFFNQQRKTFLGIDIEHKISENFILGGTFLNVSEKPITPKVNYGAEPIDNIMLGFNIDYSAEVPYFTKLVNKLPFVDTDVASNISVRADMAYLLPGSPSGIDVNGTATSYLDDFEASQTPINLNSATQWFMASTPTSDDFDGDTYDVLATNDERAKLAWYTIDQLFYSSAGDFPSNINEIELSRDEVRQVTYSELFPNTDLDVTQLNLVSTLNLAYYPNERGPYNFNSDATEVDAQGNFINPENNWGGIMRSLTTNNFEQANVEYMQFWLMDPYDNYSITEEEGLPANVNPDDLTNQVGKLFINLGNISEDILRDGYKQYENGLPGDGTELNDSRVNESNWGNTPSNPSILYAFSNDDGERAQQDVGLDGLNDVEEAAKYPAFALEEDPSGDNFQFFRGSELDAIGASVLTRYKDYNNTQGNSPTANQSEESYPTSSTTYPDTEDINKDQTMNPVSSYFEYEISLNKADLVQGSNNIVDVKTNDITLPNGQTRSTTWYQFRIPVRNGYTEAVNITDFNSIRFMRMYLTQFKMPVVLRFGELELVRGDWRRYTKTLDPNVAEDDLSIDELNDFEVGVVSIEANESRYALPPGIEREELQGTSTVQSQNEQSLSLQVTDLEPEKIRAIYKNISIDMRRYKNLRMFLHAESTVSTSQNNDLVAVIRFGTDLNDNYYQIEKPLALSTNLGNPSPLDVWPAENNLNIILEELANLKLQRDGASLPIIDIYPGISSNNLAISVKGSPTLAQIKTVMLGVKNNSGADTTGEVWFNELRAVGFDNDGGWAAVVNADANFADIANVSLSGSISTVGFGSVESTVQERSIENSKEYNVATNVALGKMMPKNWNMQVPMSYSYSEAFVDPKYDQQYQDITVEDALASGSDQVKQNSENSQDYTRRKSISFINVKKNRNPESKKKPKFYDVENLAVSYAFNEEFHKDYIIEKYINQNLAAGISYSFNFSPFSIEPFKNSKKLKGKYWKLIKDINFNPVPKVLAINSKINRAFNQQQSRNLVDGFSPQPELTQRNFLFDWDYTIGFDLTKSLQLNFNATNNYIYDSFGEEEDLEIFDNVFTVGRPNQYHQKLNGTYKLPVNKLPYLSFITADFGYTADFDWQASSQSILDQTTGLKYVDVVGNTIQNANTQNLNANIDFSRFYKNIGFEKLFLPKQKKVKGKKGIASSKAKKQVVQKVKLKKNASFGKKVLKGFYDVLTSVKKAKISYSENNGTLLEGYKPSVGFLGRDNYGGGLAPSLGFVFGSQTDILQRAIDRGWLVSRTSDQDYYNKNLGTTSADKLDYNISVKPIKSLTIDFRANKIKTSATTQQVDYIEGKDGPEDIDAYQTGNYSTSHYMLGTVFTDSDQLYQNFLDYRATIANRLATTSQPVSGFKENVQQVMLPAFIAAYSGNDPNSVSTGIFKNIPIPNWTLRYNGLMKFKWFKKNFSSFTLSHGYKSSYTIGNYTNNLQYDTDNNNIPDLNVSGNYQPELLISTATLIDEFSPLIRVDMKMRNSFSLKGEIRTDRSLALNFNNNTLTDIKGKEYVIGFGYKITDVKFVTKFTGRKETLKGDINLRADISLRENLTLIRSIDEDNNQITGGETLFGIKFTADYNLSKSLTTSFYYNHNTYQYAISTNFPRQSINAGFNLIYNLGN